MMIDSISRAGYTPYTAPVTNTAKTGSAGASSAAEEEYAPNVDAYVPSTRYAEEEAETAATETKKAALTKEQVAEIENQIYDSMKSLVETLLGIQLNGGESASELAESLGLGTTPEEAAKAISEDGMWGVDAVATRLMDMAIMLSGGDSSKAELLREAVKKGFEEAGGLENLPQVCQDTYTEVMNRFDYWEANGSMDGYGESAEG